MKRGISVSLCAVVWLLLPAITQSQDSVILQIIPSPTGQGVSVWISPPDVNDRTSAPMPFNARYNPGTQVTITAKDWNPDTRNWKFDHWSCSDGSFSVSIEITFTIQTDMACVVTFVEYARVEIVASGRHSSVPIPIEIAPPDAFGVWYDHSGRGAFYYPQGSPPVTVTVPVWYEGFRFEGWGCSHGTFPDLVLTVIPAGLGVSCTAWFEKANTVEVRSYPPGAIVTMNPADATDGVLGQAPFTAYLRVRKAMTFSAPAEHRGRAFSHWECEDGTLVYNLDVTVESNPNIVACTAHYDYFFIEHELYPNPVSSWAILRFRTNQGAVINISIVDVTGRAVEPLSGRHFEAGWHIIQMDTGHLSDGVYFIRFESGSWNDTRPFVLVRRSIEGTLH